MMRRVSGSGAVLRGLAVWWGVVLLAACAPPPVVLDETTRTEVAVAPIAVQQAAEPVAGAGPAQKELAETAGEALLIREIKVIDDNGQQGVFAKLSRAPQEVTHVTLVNPNRLVVELVGETPSNIAAARYPVEDNPLIERIDVGSDERKIRLTMVLRGDTLPSYTVDDLNDTLVAFLGEPKGSAEPVREQIVFTQRPVPGAAPAPAPVQIAAAPPHAKSASVEIVATGEQAKIVEAPAPPAPVPPAPAPAAPQAAVDVPAPPPPAGESVIAESQTGMGRLERHKAYYGRPISLDLKDADVHNVIRLLADVADINVVATDDVKGQITLRLFDVPWDQALDIIMQVQNLESVQEGNVLRISTVKRLREEREELYRAQQAAQVVEPLQVAYLRVNYAKASKLGDLISGAARAGQTRGTVGRGQQQQREEEGVLTARGSVLVDEFTNTLIVRDIRRGIRNARELVRQLDIQIPQVLIESNIVEATTDFARDLGVQWGYRSSIGPQTGTSTGANFPGTIGFGGSGLGTGSGGVPFIADFPASSVAPGLGSALDLALGSIDGSHALDVRLTALEEKGKGKIISRPRVVTLNNVPATIQSLTILRVRLPSTGTVISTGAGGSAGTSQTATEKIETGITLEVTPQVSSDGFVLLDLFAKSSQADFTLTVDNIPTEITRQATAHVLVRNGQTVVLGGIYRDQMTDRGTGVPFFSRIPGFRWLFNAESKKKRREDLLVFLTPRILDTQVKSLGRTPSAVELWESRGDQGPG